MKNVLILQTKNPRFIPTPDSNFFKTSSKESQVKRLPEEYDIGERPGLG